MTVRTAELLMGVVMGIFSIYLMVKSAELPIGWVEDEGPGGGAWPFWLAAIMLGSCVGILLNWFRKRGPVANSERTYIRTNVLIDVGAVTVSLIVTVALFSIIGVYGALPLFLAFYLRFLGKHTWRLTLLLSVIIPIVTFYFFEIVLKITLPKGFTEPLFYPLYQFFY